MNKLIRWFVANPIAVNILMLTLIIGGITGAGALKKEVIPTFESNRISIETAYLGASPSEVEQNVVIRIEEAIAGLPGIFQITSESNQDLGVVNVVVTEGYNVESLLNDIKARVDAINTLPSSIERPVIRRSLNRIAVLYFALYGDASHAYLKQIAYQMRDEMALLDGISEVAITGLKQDEIGIEISEQDLKRYNLSFDQVATAIRGTSLNHSAGAVKTAQGDLLIQARALATDYDSFADIIIKSDIQGNHIRLGDIAHINDGFSEQINSFTLNGKPGLNFEVKISDDPDLFAGTQNARDYIAKMQSTLPPELTLKINYELKMLFDERFNLLKDNALSGLFLVFVILMLFLRPIFAFWVVLGIVISFAGAVWLMPSVGISLNMLSMFAFILVLGIVVDDAIIVSESVYRHQQQGVGEQAPQQGATSVVKPVFLAVISTIIFFVPMHYVPAAMQPYTLSIFYVVLLSLLFSLVECFFILPSHLSHKVKFETKHWPVFAQIEQLRLFTSSKMENFASGRYRNGLQMMVDNTLMTTVVFGILLSVSIALFQGGWVKTSFMPNVPNTFINIGITLPPGSSKSTMNELATYVRDRAKDVQADKELYEMNNNQLFIREINKSISNNNMTIFVGLTPTEDRSISIAQISEKLKKAIGPIPEARRYSLDYSAASATPDITLNMNLSDNSFAMQKTAVTDVLAVLASFNGVSNVKSDLASERLEFDVTLKPYAEKIGLSVEQVIRQVRQGFYGEEVQRIPRSKEDVRVMLRFGATERGNIDALESMWIRTNNGLIPLETVAEVRLQPSVSSIKRTDRRRNITITAYVEEGGDAAAIVAQMMDKYQQQWRSQYAGFSLSPDGNLRTQANFGEQFQLHFVLAGVVVLAMFAIAFSSLYQPLLIFIAVPFGFVGAIWGHLAFGINLSMMSFFGFLACSGVVVNDNLVLIDRINQLRKQGIALKEAVLNAGVDRFRPIVLTSLTTFVGLLPIMFERSTQGQFLIPMVVSLAFGVLFATIVTLILIPCLYFGGYSVGDWVRQLVGGRVVERVYGGSSD